jgi:hypothetical protein
MGQMSHRQPLAWTYGSLANVRYRAVVGIGRPRHRSGFAQAGCSGPAALVPATVHRVATLKACRRTRKEPACPPF